jgi:Fe2+ transport system protein FeoA
MTLASIKVRPLKTGITYRITELHAHDETLRRMHHMGFRVDERVTLIAHLGENLIVSIQGTRYGLDLSMAALIEVEV